MAHSNKQQPDFNSNSSSEDEQRQQALARNIEDLDNSLKVDFDQKLGEISDLLARFKALVIAPSKSKAASNDHSLEQNHGESATHAHSSESDYSVQSNSLQKDSGKNAPGQECPAEDELSAEITPLFNTTAHTPSKTTSAAIKPKAPVDNSADASKASATRYTPEPARFENGLYKLNCQLYRFRLELDQEMEFREEPLHVHFRQESDLSKMFQMLNDKSSEKNPDS